MTPLFAWLLAVAFTATLWAGGVLLEETERGRRFAARAVDWIVRSRVR